MRRHKTGGRNHPWSAARGRAAKYRNGPTVEQLREKAGAGPAAQCRTLADMTPEEIAELERQYGAKVTPQP